MRAALCGGLFQTSYSREKIDALKRTVRSLEEIS